jgi:hypothetical protein
MTTYSNYTSKQEIKIQTEELIGDLGNRCAVVSDIPQGGYFRLTEEAMGYLGWVDGGLLQVVNRVPREIPGLLGFGGEENANIPSPGDGETWCIEVETGMVFTLEDVGCVPVVIKEPKQ